MIEFSIHYLLLMSCAAADDSALRGERDNWESNRKSSLTYLGIIRMRVRTTCFLGSKRVAKKWHTKRHRDESQTK
ncbi:hypothetical protein B0T10DRAFT_477606 [Thelonectria olida]|uniref:Secreted protein n=1 Tax=Thelonectria olida TaxID=1576542 RepID=A0A9P8WC07_9HYPO|nr:hypothetical protein B0T10DRAFT_477606 [Thelonectria olida]